MKISNEVANVLGNSLIEENLLFLPEGQLERKLYLAVNKVLVALGGKWNRKVQAHIFNNNPLDIVEEVLLTGEYIDAKTEYQFFETPEGLAKELVYMADIGFDDLVLEPSAGRGAIARHIPFCGCIELNPDNRQYLKDNGFSVRGEDFLKYHERYDIIIANPPFTKQQDIEHVNHMLDLANKRVVSVMSASVLFRTNKKTELFRERIDALGGIITALPEKTFSKSGTNVNTCVVCVEV